MAAASAMAAASVAFSSLYISSSVFTKPSLNCRNIRRIPFIRSAISSSSTEFNITFGSGTKKTLNPKQSSEEDSLQPKQSNIQSPFVIPWIVRGEDGKLQLQSTPPAPLLHAMANAKTTSTTTKKKKKVGTAKAVLSSEPKHSKAARRFYNENFRDPPQRISKVLAASGGKKNKINENALPFYPNCSCTI